MLVLFDINYFFCVIIQSSVLVMLTQTVLYSTYIGLSSEYNTLIFNYKFLWETLKTLLCMTHEIMF